MGMGKYLSSLTKPELEEVKELLNLTDEQEAVFLQLSKGKSNIVIADNCRVSAPTVDKRIREIKSKLERLEVRN